MCISYYITTCSRGDCIWFISMELWKFRKILASSGPWVIRNVNYLYPDTQLRNGWVTESRWKMIKNFFCDCGYLFGGWGNRFALKWWLWRGTPPFWYINYRVRGGEKVEELSYVFEFYYRCFFCWLIEIISKKFTCHEFFSRCTSMNNGWVHDVFFEWKTMEFFL